MLCNLRQGLIFLHIQSNYSFTICWQYYPFFTELPLHPGKIQLTICTHESISRLYSIGLFVYICSNIIPSCYYSFPGVYREVDRIPWRRKWQPTPVFLPGESPWTEEPGRLQSMVSQRVDMTEYTHTSTCIYNF